MDFGNISQLTELFLDDNELTYFIPATMFNISSLLNVALGINSLFGPLLLDERNNCLKSEISKHI